jgi:LEA14-like dessication related protein
LTAADGAGWPRASRWCCLLLALCLSACASLQGEFDPPGVSVESVRSVPGSGAGPRFEISLRVTNPNKQALDIAGIGYTVSLMGRELVNGVTNEVPRIEPYSEQTVTVEAGFNTFQLLRLLAELGRAPDEELAYEVAAKIDFEGLVPTQRVTESGVIRLD